MVGRATVESLRPRRQIPGWLWAILLPLLGGLLALLVGGILIAIAHVDPLTAYAALIRGGVGGRAS